jgi:hypothetical protein
MGEQQADGWLGAGAGATKKLSSGKEVNHQREGTKKKVNHWREGANLINFNANSYNHAGCHIVRRRKYADGKGQGTDPAGKQDLG